MANKAGIRKKQTTSLSLPSDLCSTHDLCQQKTWERLHRQMNDCGVQVWRETRQKEMVRAWKSMGL